MWLSANEISALAVKAARGAGLPLGHAEDIGRASVGLARGGRLDVLCIALNGDLTVKTQIGAYIDHARIAVFGPTVLDLVIAGSGPIVLGNPDAPELMVALAQGISGAKVMPCDGGLRVSFDPDFDPETDINHGAIEVTGDIIDTLNTLAAKTYVPASEASRIAGAGAGLTDND